MAVSSTGSTTATGQFAAQIEALLGREKAPLTDLLARRAALARTQGVLTDLGTKLSALRTALDGLQNTGSLSPLSLFKASTGDANMVDATPSSSASRGTHQVAITDLAQNHSLAGSAQTKTSTS